VKRYIELVHLGDQLHKMPHQLSGGQKQRVALARALVTEPRVVLFDEPLGSLDANLRKAMQVELKRMHRELGATFIYVTHDQDEAMTMSDLVAVMQDSRLLQLASPEEIYSHPKSSAVARFIGGANIISGCVEAADSAETVIRLKDGTLVRAAPTGESFSKGKSVQLMMRAEHFVFDRSNAGTDVNWLSGRVVERLFLGRSVEYHVSLGESGDSLNLLDQSQERLPVTRDNAFEFGIKRLDIRVLAN
jgi:ABC-type Fe3+/spermidine/putrescine transport system ATPase subunit